MLVCFVYRVNNASNRANGRLRYMRDDFGNPLVFFPASAADFKRSLGEHFRNLRPVRYKHPLLRNRYNYNRHLKWGDYTKEQLLRLYAKLYDRLADGMGYQPYGMDYPTMQALKPACTALVRELSREIAFRESVRS